MSDFKQYRRKETAELAVIDITQDTATTLEYAGVSISQADLDNGSPKEGDMLARNPKNHNDKWLVAKAYFEDNFEPVI